jgi:IS30 family transposase
MSFSAADAGVVERLLWLVDASVSVQSAAQALGISRDRAYWLLREVGRPAGRPMPRIGDAQRERVLEAFITGNNINTAAIAAGVSFGSARRILVWAGYIRAEATGRGKPQARRRFDELIEAGWSSARAGREVGVHERTARDWRAGVRKVRGKRIYPGAAVADSQTGTRYTTSMKPSPPDAVSERYLSLNDRLAIADGLLVRQSFTAIAERIGKNKSTVSREVRERSIDGLYLTHAAHQEAARAEVRPKLSKLAVHATLRQQVEDGLPLRLSPEQISNRLRKDFPHDEGMRVSHETIYQVLYFQARGVAERLRLGDGTASLICASPANEPR